MKKQFRFTKEGIKFGDKKSSFFAPVPYDYSGLVSLVGHEDRINFIKLLDQDSEDWDVTEMSFRHFAEAILEGMREERRDDDKLFDSSLYDLIDELKRGSDKSRKQFNK